MQSLDVALQCANQGWLLFPAFWDGKRHKGLIEWGQLSSDDPDTIRNWAARWPKAHFCVNIRASGITVLDIDVKAEKNGVESLNELIKTHGPLPHTLMSTTPSGGFHYFFEGDCAHTVCRLGVGIDTPVMVPIPGSRVEGKGDYELAVRGKLAALPNWVRDIAGFKPEKSPLRDEPLCDLDEPHNIEAAISYLDSIDGVTQGEGANHRTYQIAATVRDKGVSEEVCAQIMLEHWYPKCSPSDKPEFIERLVRNAYTYALKRAGNNTPEALFTRSTTSIYCASDIDPLALKPPDWVLGYRYIAGYVTVTIAPGGAGKSLFVLLEGLAIATGRSLTGEPVRKKGAVWYYNAEDAIEEMHNRVYAARRHHRIPRKEATTFFYTSGYENPMKLVKPDDRGNPVANREEIENVINELKAREVVLWIIDPYVEIHGLDENSNTNAIYVIQVLRYIARSAGCAISLVHHTSKGKASEGVGNMDKARGASSLAFGGRVAHTIYSMSPQEGATFGLPPGQEKWYVRVDDAKANLGPPGEKTKWYRKVSVNIFFDSPDSIGTLEVADLECVSEESGDMEIRSYVISRLDPGESMSVHQLAVGYKRDGSSMYSKQWIMKKIASIFTTPVEEEPHVFVLRKSGEKGTPRIHCEMNLPF